MPGQLAIIQGHPDPAGNRLCHALADAYADGASSANHEVSRIEIAKIDFPLLGTQQDFETGALPEMLLPARDALVAAQHVLIVFPLWHGTMPALLKGFIEQVMRPGVALEYRKEGFPRRLLAGWSAHLIVTMGMPALICRRRDEKMGRGVYLLVPSRPVRGPRWAPRGVLELASVEVTTSNRLSVLRPSGS